MQISLPTIEAIMSQQGQRMINPVQSEGRVMQAAAPQMPQTGLGAGAEGLAAGMGDIGKLMKARELQAGLEPEMGMGGMSSDPMQAMGQSGLDKLRSAVQLDPSLMRFMPKNLFP